MPQLGYRHPEDPVPVKLSDLIAKLQEVQAEHGDLEVLYRDMNWGQGEATTHRLYGEADQLHEVIDASDHRIKWSPIAQFSDPDQQFIIIDTNGV